MLRTGLLLRKPSSNSVLVIKAIKSLNEISDLYLTFNLTQQGRAELASLQPTGPRAECAMAPHPRNCHEHVLLVGAAAKGSEG